jgi:hypothetical protein
MNNFTFISPEDYFELPNACTKSLRKLRALARRPDKLCEVCGREKAWKLADTGLCFSCTTGEADASDDYELKDRLEKK